MTFSPGDRIRYECTGDDGLPLVRYGFVGGVAGSDGPVVVLLDATRPVAAETGAAMVARFGQMGVAVAQCADLLQAQGH